jgi:NADPH:quinone reductase-like Zn-dependent oxidoreductase
MKAVYIERHGGPEELKYGELPDPVAGPGEVVVDVHAASINGADWKVRAGGSYKPAHFPHILGRDFSGVVSALGEGIAEFRIGEPVFGVSEANRESCYAEKLAIRAAIVAPKPGSLSHVEAAAVALVGLTAVVSIEETLKLKAGETILIQGGAGGVAAFAIQLAKHIGARVITTTSPANLAYVRGLGADEVIDYTTQDFTSLVSGCDAVFETVGGDVARRSFAVVKPGGRAAFIASGPQAPASPRPDVASLRPNVARSRRHLERIAALVTSGVVRLPEIATFPLAEAAAALAVSEGRHFRGKLVLEVR